MQRYRRFRLFSWICVSLFLCPLLLSRQLPENMKLEKVEATGSPLFTAREIMKMSGLGLGQTVTMAELEAASRTLGDWGYFSRVSFAYKYQGTNLTVTFQLQDEQKLFPCLFDNFTQISDQEIIAEVRKEYPSFGGKVPGNGTANRYVQSTIENLLARKGSPAKVDYSPYLRSGNESLMVFRQDGDARVCSVRIESADREVEAGLLAASANLQGEPYSRQKIGMFSEVSLAPAVRRNGYWRFEVLEARPVQEPTCPGGVTLFLRVKYGPAHSWNKVTWSGNQQQTASVLDDLLGMQQGEMANIEKIQAGLSKVSKFYWSSGYLDVSVQPDSVVDPQQPELSYRIRIEEGERYKMGDFICGQKNQAGPCDSLRSKWKLKTAENFNGGYFDDFEKTSFADWKKQNTPPAMILGLRVQKDPAKKVANVVIVNLKN